MADSVIEQEKQSVIIVGAGAAGLIAARDLAIAGLQVMVLEAATMPGGRMRTQKTGDFSEPVELGAEFVHGPLPLTLGLLAEAGIETTPVVGDMKTVRAGRWVEEDAMSTHWESLMHELADLKEDITVSQFLERNYNRGAYEELRKSIRRFAEGFDLADPDRASILALKEEWAQEEEEQYRINGGYLNLVNYLVDTCLDQGVTFYFSQEVEAISWNEGGVEVKTSKQSFTASRVLVTVSAGVMQRRSIRFMPELTEQLRAYDQIGFGMVVKFIFEFSSKFWESRLPNGGFILSDESIPTWWTGPGQSKLLTGWIGGPAAAALQKESDETLIKQAVQCLANIFGIPVDELRKQSVCEQVVRWEQEPHIHGGYSYSLPGSADAKQLLLDAVNSTIYFAGEAVYTGDSPGTVEAALQTGVQLATRILAEMPLK